ncbi:MAG: cache domain-containing protein, partial [Clostridia bacterium]
MKFKKNAVKIFFALAIAVISIWTFFDFSLQLQNVLTNSTYKTLSEISLHYNKAFVDRIAYNTRTMNVLSGSLHKMCDMSKEEIMRVLQNAVDDGGYTKMIVCNTDGNTLSNDGISINVSHRDYFKKALRGEINISDPLVTTINHDEAIVIAVPICTNKDISGVLFGVYPLETAGEQLLDSTYYSDGYGFIISPDGKILLSSKHKDKLCDEKNLFDFFDKTTFSNFSVSQIKSAMANGESKSFSFKYDGKNRFVTFMPSTVNDWYTFSIASDTLILRQEKVTNKVVLKLLIRIALIVIA